MFNMLLLNSIRVSYSEREENVYGSNVIGLAMWFYGIVLPLCWYAAIKGVEFFWFDVPEWAWVVLTIHLIVEQLSVVAMFRLRSLSVGKDGVPFYKNIGKGKDDVFNLEVYLCIVIFSFVILSTEIMEAPSLLFWPLLFIASTALFHFFNEISSAKERYYRDRSHLISICHERKFACEKKD